MKKKESLVKCVRAGGAVAFLLLTATLVGCHNDNDHAAALSDPAKIQAQAQQRAADLRQQYQQQPSHSFAPAYATGHQ